MATGMMTAQESTGAGKSHSFEQVWATMDRIAAEAAERKKESAEEFRELKRLHAETEKVLKEVGERHKETERALRETVAQMKENDRKMAESSARTDRKLDRLSANVGGLSHSLGELVETLIAARLWEKFKVFRLERGFQRVTVYDGKRAMAEIDILLSNTKYAIAVEVKTHLDKMEYVDRHIERMELIRRFPPAEVAINHKRVMGALAGGVVSPAVMEYAHKCGFYVLELSGESVRFADTPDGFEARVW
jgi:hypothetical protein